MSHLSERAEAVQTWLEGEWTTHYRRNLAKPHESKGDKGWQSGSLVERLKKKGICTTELDGWLALSELAKAGVIEAPDALHHRVSVLVKLSEALRHRLESEFAEIDDSLTLDAGQAAVWRHALDGMLRDWSLDDQRRLADGLRALAAALPEAYELSAFEASARYLLGSSKLLLSLPPGLLHAFAIDTAAFRGPAAWVLAAMPAEPRGLLLIENPQSFDQACRIGLHERLALVCSFGYGLSLNEALNAPRRVRLIGEGAASRSLDELLTLPSPTYWGDLDPEGLRIFQCLRQAVPELRLSALYGPMIETLEAHGGHPLTALTGKPRQRHAGDWARGLDQEALDDAQLTALAGQALDAESQRRWLGYLINVSDETN